MISDSTDPRHVLISTRSLACILRKLMSMSRVLCLLTSPHAVHRLCPIHALTLACSRTAAACWSSCNMETSH